MIVAVGNDSQFLKFCEVTGRSDLPQDPRFTRNSDRVRNRGVLVPLLAGLMKQRSRADWLQALEAAKVPCGPINDLADVFADPQVQFRGMTVDMPHPLAGNVRLVGSPMKFSETPVQYRHAPPLLGEHTLEVLKEIGLSDDEIASLRRQNVI
jgi:crotonobetainyl-CoA:carnitine CoA-transferase CaiB-like acyl-CoA transferase